MCYSATGFNSTEWYILCDIQQWDDDESLPVHRARVQLPNLTSCAHYLVIIMMLHPSFILTVMLFGFVASSVVIDPMNPILRAGQVTKMRCQAPSSIINCVWSVSKIDSVIVNLIFGNLEDNECGFELETEYNNNKTYRVYCTVLLSNSPDPYVSNSTEVTIAVLPKIHLESEFSFDDNDTITVNAGEESTLYCNLVGARPRPDVLWKIGNPIRNQFVC